MAALSFMDSGYKLISFLWALKRGVPNLPRMDFDNEEYIRYNNYKNEIISFLEGC